MQKPLLYKSLGILALILLMSLALGYVNDLIIERQARQASVENNIAQSSTTEQTLTGPILMIPYTEHYTETIGSGKDSRTIERKEEGRVYLLPNTLDLAGDFAHHYKQRGIFKALMYRFNGDIAGTFNLDQIKVQTRHQNGNIHYGQTTLAIGLSDTRGIDGQPVLQWGNQTLPLKQGTQLSLLDKGIHADLGSIKPEQASVPFKLNLHLRGMQAFNMTPLADKNTVRLHSAWQHPHFDGHFLPEAASQRISNKGFEAQWEVSSLASNIQQKLITNLNRPSGSLALETISVGFVEPINIYSLSDRATKYGLLFIGLTFAGFFIFEVMKQLRIHPAQYTLVGLAMAIFYLLLISLAEHIGFAYAYLIASMACISLIGYYLTNVMQNIRYGMVFSIKLSLLYATLYAILVSEDNALLMGSLLIFSLLVFTMVITRKVDWYALSNS
ncbi:cell envelope integrity protein CreD [Methylophilus sp. 5]|uniref:cell envelope integrity protein CreD n=1 Tax=Methylophilus sp. 5 TaxID=1112274 RepID=UPI000491970C|nr:cell envelope integrity protein CreD [Methylophilus sp. 5]